MSKALFDVSNGQQGEETFGRVMSFSRKEALQFKSEQLEDRSDFLIGVPRDNSSDALNRSVGKEEQAETGNKIICPQIMERAQNERIPGLADRLEKRQTIVRVRNCRSQSLRIWHTLRQTSPMVLMSRAIIRLALVGLECEN